MSSALLWGVFCRLSPVKYSGPLMQKLRPFSVRLAHENTLNAVVADVWKPLNTSSCSPVAFYGTPPRSWQPFQSPPADDKPPHIRSTRPAGPDGAAAAGTESPGEGSTTHTSSNVTSACICVYHPAAHAVQAAEELPDTAQWFGLLFTHPVSLQVSHLDLQQREVSEDLQIVLVPLQSVAVTLDGLVIFFIGALQQAVHMPAWCGERVMEKSDALICTRQRQQAGITQTIIQQLHSLNRSTEEERIQTWLLRSLRKPRLTSS